MSLSARLILLLAGLLALLATHWRAYTMGVYHEQNATQASQAQALRQSAAAAIRHADNAIEAAHERAKTERRIAMDRLAAAGELERLHRDLQANRSATADQHASATDAPALDSLLDAMARDIERLAQQGAAIAQNADAHAADALMLQRICQKNQKGIHE